MPFVATLGVADIPGILSELPGLIEPLLKLLRLVTPVAEAVNKLLENPSIANGLATSLDSDGNFAKFLIGSSNFDATRVLPLFGSLN